MPKHNLKQNWKQDWKALKECTMPLWKLLCNTQNQSSQAWKNESSYKQEGSWEKNEYENAGDAVTGMCTQLMGLLTNLNNDLDKKPEETSKQYGEKYSECANTFLWAAQQYAKKACDYLPEKEKTLLLKTCEYVKKAANKVQEVLWGLCSKWLKAPSKSADHNAEPHGEKSHWDPKQLKRSNNWK